MACVYSLFAVIFRDIFPTSFRNAASGVGVYFKAAVATWRWRHGRHRGGEKFFQRVAGYEGSLQPLSAEKILVGAFHFGEKQQPVAGTLGVEEDEDAGGIYPCSTAGKSDGLWGRPPRTGKRWRVVAHRHALQQRGENRGGIALAGDINQHRIELIAGRQRVEKIAADAGTAGCCRAGRFPAALANRLAAADAGYQPQSPVPAACGGPRAPD